MRKKVESPSLPSNWQAGHIAPYRLYQSESPFLINGRWFLYVFDESVRDNAVYSFSEDIYLSYTDFRRNVLGETFLVFFP
jgi:hypothetical protein